MNPHNKNQILAICGSTRQHSGNLQLISHIGQLAADLFDLEIYDQLTNLPAFNPDFATENIPQMVVDLRAKIAAADGVLICTPEYVFSLPGILKNAIEWTVASTVFSGKPTAIITAAADGRIAHESLQLVMKTIEATMTPQTQLLIRGARSKVNEAGIMDAATLAQVKILITSFDELIKPSLNTAR